MIYTIKRETTGKVGFAGYDHDVTVIHRLPCYEAALAEMKYRREKFLTDYGISADGTDEDYTLAIERPVISCVDRYWIEEEP